MIDNRISPGLVVHDILVGDIPVLTTDDEYKVVDIASPSDFHRTYRDLRLRQERGTKLGGRLPSIARYHTFNSYVYMAVRMGLLVLVGTEPAPRSALPGAERHLYALTELGKQETDSWSRLNQAFAEFVGRTVARIGTIPGWNPPNLLDDATLRRVVARVRTIASWRLNRLRRFRAPDVEGVVTIELESLATEFDRWSRLHAGSDDPASQRRERDIRTAIGILNDRDLLTLQSFLEGLVSIDQ